MEPLSVEITEIDSNESYTAAPSCDVVCSRFLKNKIWYFIQLALELSQE